MLICMLGSKGGVGKSTTLALISEELQRRGISNSLADSDPQGSLMDISNRSEGRLPKAFAVFPRDFERLAEQQMLTLLDTPSGLREESLTAVAVSDLAIVPISPSALDLSALSRTLKQIKRAQLLRKMPLEVLIVPTRLNKREKASRELLKALQKAELPVSKSTLNERSAFRRASGSGGLAALPHSSRRLALKEIESLVTELEKTIKAVNSKRLAALQGSGH